MVTEKRTKENVDFIYTANGIVEVSQEAEVDINELNAYVFGLSLHVVTKKEPTTCKGPCLHRLQTLTDPHEQFVGVHKSVRKTSLAVTKWQFAESNRVLSEVGCRKNGDETSVILWQMAKLHMQVSPCMFQKCHVIPLRANID